MDGQKVVLVVDDEPIMRKIAVKVLQSAGYKVLYAEDGEEGLEVFKENKDEVQLVVLDMLMPKMSGKETYIEMKLIDPNVKVLLTSGFREDERVDDILKMGVEEFIEKPYTFTQLTQAVQKILNP